MILGYLLKKSDEIFDRSKIYLEKITDLAQYANPNDNIERFEKIRFDERLIDFQEEFIDWKLNKKNIGS